ncbi:ABC transporter, periplasmic substrate-binding protein, NMT1/THI5-like domain-containing [Geotalea daltonii FRC-32]|uniref:ABC transporter, periplasmic substrate-binding protein, NMT1/THI5-like domain-containing n=1 Tax=Geotalea daltonii (strain DSM 22248 / JCM 15807 / FRC-32) TaxID=316067 RepID=B9M261_GEODF|nr:NrtA/SsuA/CpmA family ABC transporter substrate-binding protein [Geotalea daltonii]ACM21179.1 ABC transporter, periplasmic substrate-binding protein, NMT1/THI5-like domain-containing [Geotalea daltonii FRC-32]
MKNRNVAPSIRHHLTWVVIMFAVTAGCVFFIVRAHLQQKTLPLKNVTIAIPTLPFTALAQIAQQQGFYLQEGLLVTPQVYPYGKPALQAVMDGSADFAVVAETPFTFAVLNGKKISIVATILTSSEAHAIVARKDRGIIKYDDLKGRSIGATLGTSGHFFMDAFLIAHGISIADVKVVDLKPEEMVDALANGTVDAISTWQPFLFYAQQKMGDRGVSFKDEDIHRLTFNIIATHDFIRHNPEQVAKVIRALVKAEEFAIRDPVAAQKIVADFCHLDREVLRQFWPAYSFQVTLDQSLLLALEDESQWAMANGLVKKRQMPNYLNFIYYDGMQSVKPERLMILR